MEQKLKRVKRVEHLYERAYKTASGEKRVKFYAIFTWKLKHKRRVISFGSDLTTAKVELAQVLADNMRGKDFDAVEEPQKQGLRFREWAEDYFKNKIDPTRKAGGLERERRSYKRLETFFGDMLLTEIKRSVIMQYRNKRLQDPVIRSGKVVTVDGKSVEQGGTPQKPKFLTSIGSWRCCARCSI